MNTGAQQRKDELFATITLLSSVEMKIAELQALGASYEDLRPLLERRGVLAADEKRLTLEVYNESLYGNLGDILSKQNDTLQEIRGAVARLDTLQQEFSGMAETVSDHDLHLKDHDTQIAALHKRIAQAEARLNSHDGRLDVIEEELSAITLRLAEGIGKMKALRGE